jgi:cytochrome c
LRSLVLAILLLGSAGARGETPFASHCASCHSLAPGPSTLPGPSLARLAGRVVASDPAFDYSPALRAARTRGMTWTAALLDQFLADPEAMLPGLWMGGRGISDTAERAAIVRELLR